MKSILTLALVSALSLSFSVAGASETINGAGASFPYPVYSAWAYEYQKLKGVRINYQSIGSGGGVRQIVSRTVDFGASDDALRPEEIEKDRLLQWPQVIGGIVIAINLPGVEAARMILDAETLCKIFLGEIKYWDDQKIKALNPSLNFPHNDITIVHRSDGSGTTAVFTHYLAEACPVWKKKIGEGKSVNWPYGIGAKGNEGVANYVKRTPYSIGYMEYAYAKQNNLSYTLLTNPSGKVVAPTLETFQAAAAYGEYDPRRHFYTWLTNTKGTDAWPIVAATNILVAKEKVEQNRKVVKFFDWAFSQKGDEIAKSLVYAPLPESLKSRVRQYWKTNGIY